MNKAQQAIESRAEKLRNEIADTQAKLDHLRDKLAKLEAKQTGEPAPETGLDMLWNAAPAMAKTRSSKFACRAAWNRIPPRDRPRVSDMLEALRKWSRCGEWKKDDGMFIPALDRWIKERRWEFIPEDVKADPMARYRRPEKPVQTVDPEDVATPEEIAEFLKMDWLKPSQNPTP